MKVCVIGGAGYVGLITGLGLAELGHDVINVDVDQDRVQGLQAGRCHLYEDGIDSLLNSNLDASRIRFSTDLRESISDREVVFITVGTPSLPNGQSDLSQIIQVAKDLASNIGCYKLIVIKSTVPAGTIELIRNILDWECVEGEDFDIAVNPEFLQEGNGLRDFFYPHRIVVGTNSERAKDTLRKLYQTIIDGAMLQPQNGATSKRTGPVPLIETDLASAQMIKYASNAFLAARISFINEIASLCEVTGADVEEVVRGVGYDPRIGHAYLQPGLGFGGPCLEKDLTALIHLGDGNGHNPQFLKSVLERNNTQVSDLLVKLKDMCGNVLLQKTVAVLGLAFKSGTNDVRSSLALNVIDQLQQEGATVHAFDPVAMPEAKAIRPDIIYFEDPYQAVDDADALMILTGWPYFTELDYEQIKARMASPYIVDGRNLLDSQTVRALGFSYVGFGRP